MGMDKKYLRQLILEKLKTHPIALKKQRDEQLLKAIIKTETYQNSQRIATYLAFPHEFATNLLIQQALKDKKSIYIPKTFSCGKMEFTEYDPKHLIRTKFGLLESNSKSYILKNDLDMIHVPGLLFNEDGFRIGYGGGFYDRYLSDFKGATLSSIYSFQLGNFYQSSHDVAVKELVITDEKNIR